MGEENYTIIQVLQNMSREEMMQEIQLYPSVVVRNAFSGYVTLFIPVVAALPFVQMYHAEVQSGYKRFFISRKSCFRYYRDKWFAGMLVSGFMLLAVAALFHAFILFTLPMPDLSEFEYLDFGKENMVVSFLKIYTGIFFYGIFSTIPAILVSVFTTDFYFLICIPFIFTYFWDICISGLASVFVNDPNGLLLNLVEQFYSKAYLWMAESWKDFLIAGGKVILILLVLFAIYHLVLKKKFDSGI